MMNYGRSLPFLFAAMLMVVAAALTGCGDDKTVSPPAPVPPDLPPQSSFAMDFESFDDVSTVFFQPIESLESMSKQNWGQSALRVGFWNITLTITLAVPVAAFNEAFKHDPIQLDDGSWQWSYNVSVSQFGTQMYSCRLIGDVIENEVQWSMYISKEGAFEDFLWYTGTHNLPATEGTWTAYLSPSHPDPLLGIEWHRNVSTSTGDLKYTYIVPEDAENGAYIYFGSTTDEDFDRFYNIYSISQDNLAEIEWSFSDKNGRVKDEHFYGDTDWHCWDTNLDDVDCP